MTKPHHTSRDHRRGRASSAAAIRPVHDARAWLLFFLVATMLLATVPLARNAEAQLPIPLPGQSEDPEPTEPPADPTEEPTEESPIPTLPSGGDEEEPPASTGEFKTAYFTAPTDELIANTDAIVTAQCILFPDTCTPEAQEITGPVLEGVAGAEAGVTEGTEGAPQPVPPGRLPVGLANGNQRYASAVDIGPPDVPAGKTVSEYLISFTISPASFAVESPAFREAALAALSSTDGSPDAFQAYFESVATQETPLLTPNITGLEACVISEPWEAGENQPQEAQPEVDFFYCSSRAEPDENNVVTFDMTFPAQDALTDNEAFKLDWSNGILIRPLAAPNLAYGDADYSTNFQIYIEPLADNPPAVSVVQADKPTPPPTTPPREPTTSNSGGSTSSGGSSRPSSSSGSSRPSTSSSASRPSSPAASSGSTTSTPANTSPAAASPLGDITAATGAAETGEAAPLDFTPVNEPTKSFPIAWILLPMLLGGAFWYGRVLDGAPLTAVVRAGAMTRLLRERGFQV